MEVARKHKVAIGWHTRGASGYAGGRTQLGSRATFGEMSNPLLAHDVAAAYPDVPLVMAHGGIDGWWSEEICGLCLQVAAAHPNVYLETSARGPRQWPDSLVDFAKRWGQDKLIWGTDYPLLSFDRTLTELEDLGVTPEIYKKLVRDNVVKALKLDV